MRNVLVLVLVVLFASVLFAGCARSVQTAAQTEPTCLLPIDEVVNDKLERGWAAVTCLVGVDLTTLSMAWGCENLSGEDGGGSARLASSTSPCTYSLDPVAALIAENGWTVALCDVDIYLTNGNMVVRCQNAEAGESGDDRVVTGYATIDGIWHVHVEPATTHPPDAIRPPTLPQ